ncbi:retrotransposon protein [Cucumis melo var. makuwa]|uniref:Retrotransposon protein n=1 Tax=Cucumis melo var. makuwa TaxID=1194695 RepID=A0A5D3CW35_CUCMM|nr:retrotransposon protein [Cucumis melo var. makuwa]TYK15144.1 retrotransposon protein [Cucumis melo var. makuwa]
MSPDEVMGTQTARASDGRNVSSESKRKRGGQSLENGDIICIAIEYVINNLTVLLTCPSYNGKTQAQGKRSFDSYRSSSN